MHQRQELHDLLESRTLRNYAHEVLGKAYERAAKQATVKNAGVPADESAESCFARLVPGPSKRSCRKNDDRNGQTFALLHVLRSVAKITSYRNYRASASGMLTRNNAPFAGTDSIASVAP